MKPMFDGNRELVESDNETPQPVAEKQPPQGEAGPPNPTVSPVPVGNQIDSVEPESKSERDRNYRLQRNGVIVQALLLLATTGAFVAAAYYACIAKGQLEEMRAATVVTAKSAYAACLSAQIARAALIDSQQSATDEHEASVASTYQALAASKSQVPLIRPLVKSEPQFRQSEIFLPIDFTNIGKDARTFNVSMDAIFLPVTAKISFSYHKHMPGMEASVLGEGQNASGALVAGQVPGIAVKNPDGTAHKPTTPEDSRAYQKGEKAVVFYGRVTYFDLFGVNHWFTFCRTFDKYPDGSTSSNFPECAEYNKQDSDGIIKRAKASPYKPESVSAITCIAPKE